jgi:hypothetical protein
MAVCSGDEAYAGGAKTEPINSSKSKSQAQSPKLEVVVQVSVTGIAAFAVSVRQ